MVSPDMRKGTSLPKFGEWDVNDPASSEGFTVIFQKARDEKKNGDAADAKHSSKKSNHNPSFDPSKKRWFYCCGYEGHRVE